jgi:hypothetical protein
VTRDGDDVTRDQLAHVAVFPYDWVEKQFPGEPMSEMNITAVVETFVQNLVAAVEVSVAERVQAAIAGVFGAPQKRGPGIRAVADAAGVAERWPGGKTRPKQLCPVPGCKNVAAPVFGMVCKDHRNVAKSKIAKYRAERKGTPARGAKPAEAKKVLSPKAARARKLQGQYMGALKSLTGADRAKVKQTANDKGVAEAVKLAMTMKKA